jgi:two-component system sensor histidine kinase KdpD
VQVRETLPDAVFDAADEVELIDIAPEDLLERFREGRIYKPEQAARASKHFFTKGNLIALREMALRRTAERVDEQMRQYRHDERRLQIMPASETVLVCVGPSPVSARLLRSSRRLAAALRAKMLAVSVEPPGVSGRTQSASKQIDANLKLAEELGAQIVTLSGRNVAAEVLAYARAHNVTKIVVGKPAQSRWREIVFGSVVDDLIRSSGEIDIYVIRGDAVSEQRASRLLLPAPAAGHDWIGYGIAAAVVAVTTSIGWPLYHRLHVENENVLMIYLLGVLWVAARRSRGAAVVASVLSVLAFDVMFVPPYYTIVIADRQYVVTFLVMLLTALLISGLTHRVREQVESARARERRTAAILQLSRDLSVARTATQVATATALHIAHAIGGRAAVLLPDAANGLQLAADSVGEARLSPDEHELSVAQWAAAHAEPAGRGTGTLPGSAGRYLPMMDGSSAVGVLSLYLPLGQTDWTVDQRDLAGAMALQAAVALSRVRLGDEARTAWERVESESLRNTLLSGVSHELRTPLAGITGAATALADAGESLPPGARREMLDTLVGEAERMERLINNLLDMSRLEAGGLTLKREWTPVEEVIGAALRGMKRRLAGRQVTTTVPANLSLAFVDGAAIEQVLVNLLDNAVTYTPAGSTIEVAAHESDDQLSLEVSDCGPGLLAGAQTRVFDKFFRGKVAGNATHRGIGLGLAICRALVEAHGGKIEAVNRAEGGATFRITLPKRDQPPTVDSTG